MYRQYLPFANVAYDVTEVEKQKADERKEYRGENFGDGFNALPLYRAAVVAVRGVYYQRYRECEECTRAQTIHPDSRQADR